MKPVSVIMIAYNAEKTLDRAMKSVINQTMRDIEIICVDDCSTDRTLEILNGYAENDPRITVLHHEKNMGSFAARYTGIMYASGEYTLVIDPDDELVENACEYLVAEIKRQDVDVLQFGVIVKNDPEHPSSQSIIDDMKKRMRIPDKKLIKDELRPGELLDLCFTRYLIPFNVWNKIYRTTLLQKAVEQYSGERILMADDLLTVFMLFCYIKSYGITNHSFYIYYVGGGMSTAMEKLDESKMQRIAEEYQVYTLLKKWTKRTNVAASLLVPALKQVHTMVSDAIFWYFIHETSPDRANLFHKHLCKYYPQKEFVTDIVRYSFCDHRCDPIEVIKRLKGYPAFCDYDCKGSKRTVAMYYNRLYNGGIERVLSMLTPILMSNDYKVVIITQERENEKDYSLPENTVRVCLRSRATNSMERMKEFREIISTYGIDVMIYHPWIGDTLMLDALAIKSMSIPLILYTHSRATLPFEWGWARYHDQKAIYGLFDKVLALTEVDYAWWSALGFDTIQVVNPPTFSIKDTHVSKLNTKNCVWVGRLNKVEKQYLEAFEIAKIVHNAIPDFRMNVIGTTESAEELAEIADYIQRNDMGNYILFYGFQEDVRPFYEKASVYLSTSSVEGFGLTYIESKIFGLPMVAFDLPNIDFLRNPKGAFVVKQRDTEAAANHIIEILSNDELRNEMGKQARRDVEGLYSHDLGVIWKGIIEDAFKPRKQDSLLSLKTPLEAAVNCAMDSIVKGISTIAPVYYGGNNSTAEYDDLMEKHKELWAQFEESAQAGKDAWERFEQANALLNSKSYKLGRMLTWPVRKIKSLLL